MKYAIVKIHDLEVFGDRVFADMTVNRDGTEARAEYDFSMDAWEQIIKTGIWEGENK